ncbi:cmrf35-like molecule 7 [Limosa lapponica baueri]|uniref:Cmrf35-like molecule 7 n=1 Tax=Limosa lapponica baueri TaxID=1758121 RepID=A0A2I0TEQ1_LIMLA|nr:cmrf35-like molecule 7 [Limosa lapponica baueri]
MNLAPSTGYLVNDHGEKSASGARSWKMRIILVWTLFPGGWAVTGPKEVTVKQGGLLEVSCSYKPGYELYPKYWCRPGFLWFCFTYITQTNGSEVTVTQGRVSISDNHASRSFKVTLSGVTMEDTDWYSCGVKRRLWFNLWHSMEVMVSPAVPTMTKAGDMLATEPLGSMGSEKLSQLTITHLLLFLSVKVPMVLALACGVVWGLVFLSLASATSWVNRRDWGSSRKGTPGDQLAWVLALLAMSGAVLWVSLRGG